MPGAFTSRCRRPSRAVRLAGVAGCLALAVAGCGSASAPSQGPSQANSSVATSPISTASPLTAPSLDPNAPVGGHNRKVFVEGDSVLLGTVDTLPPLLKHWKTTMNCVGSRRLTEAIPVLRHKRKHLGAVVVIQMGNNFIPGEDGTFASQIHTTMHILRNVKRVVWVTVAHQASSQVHIDKAIHAAARKYPTIRVANWAPISDRHPRLTYDGLHLTPPGRERMSHLIAKVVGPAPSA